MTRPVDAFFYGSYMNVAVLEEVDLFPGSVEVAVLAGFDLRIEPLANLVRSPGHEVYGILTAATHAELDRLYSHARHILGGIYFPESVVVQLRNGESRPALCYIAPAMQARTAQNDYIDRIVGPAKEYGFPDWYLEHIESFRSGSS